MGYEILDVTHKDQNEIRYLGVEGNELVESYGFAQAVWKNWSETEDMTKIISKLTPYFQLRNKNNIGKYLSSNLFLLSVLEECYQNIGDYFPNDGLALEVIQDPMDNNEKLAIFITTHLNPKNAIKTLRTFNIEWWIQYSSQTQNKLLIDVEST